MDYSVLLAIEEINTQEAQEKEPIFGGGETNPQESGTGSHRDRIQSVCSNDFATLEGRNAFHSERRVEHDLPSDSFADGESFTKSSKQVYHMAIIDYLQEYGFIK